MTTIPEISFVMPAYNVENYISKSIESVLSQTFSNWELIIMDDCSTDNTLKIAKNYEKQDNRIHVFQMDFQSGSVLQPRKAAILRSSSNIISPLDADDWIEKEYAESLLNKKFLTGSNIVYPTMYKVADELCEPVRLVPLSDNLYKIIKSGKESVILTLDGWKIGCNGGLIDKKIYLEAFKKFGASSIRGFADELLTRQLLFLSEKVSFSPARYFYRFNQNSITNRPSIKLFGYIHNNISLIDFSAKEYGLDSKEYIMAQRQNFHGYFDALKIINRGSIKGRLKKEAFKLMLKAKERFDRRVLKKYASNKYLLLSYFPKDIIRMILKIYNR